MFFTAIWLPASLLAGLFQAWRTALQQRLRSELTVSGAGLVRYAYGTPVALLLAWAYLSIRHIPLPAIDAKFLAFAATGGLAQVFGTVLLIMAFGHRGFVAGTAFAKTEALQAALFGVVVLGEQLTLFIWAAVLIGVAGVLLLALGGRALKDKNILAVLGQPAALCGLGAGALFALTGVLVRRATFELDMVDPVASALVTLTIVLALQTAMHGGYVAWREPATWRQVAITWRSSGQVGLLSALGSACWFTGFATAPVALVRVVGQVEVIFTLGFARLYLHEKMRAHEVIGLILVGVGVILALLASTG